MVTLDEHLIAQAEALATGRNIHDMRSLVCGYKDAVWFVNHRSDTEETRRNLKFRERVLWAFIANGGDAAEARRIVRAEMFPVLR
jgi:hypothetical protein